MYTVFFVCLFGTMTVIELLINAFSFLCEIGNEVRNKELVGVVVNWTLKDNLKFGGGNSWYICTEAQLTSSQRLLDLVGSKVDEHELIMDPVWSFPVFFPPLMLNA